jgi:hypothetical protein
LCKPALILLTYQLPLNQQVQRRSGLLPAGGVYLYGYLNQVQSSRRLKQGSAAQYRADVARRVSCAEFKTIAEFRKGVHASAFARRSWIAQWSLLE